MIFMILLHGNWCTQQLDSLLPSFAAYLLHSTQTDLILIAKTVSYSMWPIILTVLNFPRKVRYSHSNFWLVGTIPGNGSKEPHSLDPYLSVLVDKLLEITNKVVFDSYQNAPFNLKVDILLYILDYKGVGKVFNLMGPNAYQACAWCDLEGKTRILS